MLSTHTISATDARNNWFEVLNYVHFSNKDVYVTKNNKTLVKISPVRDEKEDRVKSREAFFGMLRDAPRSDWPTYGKKCEALFKNS